MGTAERTRGFTLVEAVVALAVLAVGIVLAGTLLVQAQRMIAQAGIEARTPASGLVVSRLRGELQGAAGVVSGTSLSPGWSRDRLDLVYPDGRQVRWEKRGATLTRRVVKLPSGSTGTGAEVNEKGGSDTGSGPGIGGAGSGRVVLRGVVSWRWVQRAPRLVSVEIVTLEGEDRGRILDPVGPIGRDSRPQTREITVALRGGGLGWGW